LQTAEKEAIRGIWTQLDNVTGLTKGVVIWLRIESSGGRWENVTHVIIREFDDHMSNFSKENVWLWAGRPVSC